MSIYPVQQPIHPFLNHSHPTTNTTTRVRPTLKRSQSPFTSDLLDSPSTDRKKQRTSPTCNAFAKLSLTSPPIPISTEVSQPTSISLLKPKPKVQLETSQDQRMRSVYSAYEIGPDRIFVDSLGSEPSSPIETTEDSNQPQLRVACQVPISRIDLPLTPLLEHDQQLVLYRPPVHLTLNQSSSTANHLHQSASHSENLDVDVDVDVDVAMELD